MKLKVNLRDVIWLLYWFVTGSCAILAIIGKGTIITNILLSVSAFNIIFRIINLVMYRTQYKEIFKMYKETFQILKSVHGKRYTCYINGQTEEIEKCNEAINECSRVLLQTAPAVLNNGQASESERQEIREIIEKTKELTKTIIPPA